MSTKALDWLIYGAAAVLWLFTAAWVRPGWIPLMLLGIILCGAGMLGQMLFRWAFGDIPWQVAATGAAYAALLMVFGGVEIVYDASTLRLAIIGALLVAIALHVRARKQLAG